MARLMQLKDLASSEDVGFKDTATSCFESRELAPRPLHPILWQTICASLIPAITTTRRLCHP
eukprot:9149506-Alexandrium_andersonii.AAC.1